MNNERFYPKPVESTELPPSLVNRLQGQNLQADVHSALRLITVNEDGWPHVSQLSFGEVLALDAGHLRFVISPHTHTTNNIHRTGQLLLSLVDEGAVWELRLSATHQAEIDIAGSHNSTVFDAKIQGVSMHKVPYAELISDIRFRLIEPAEVLARWQQQLAAMRDLK